MKRIHFVAVALALSVAACSGDASGPSESSVTGSYTLQTVDGRVLPVILLQDATGRLEVTSGIVSLNQDGTFSDVTQFRVTSGTEVLTDADAATGAYQRAGNNITFNVSDGSVYTMALSGTTLTQNVNGTIWVYRK